MEAVAAENLGFMVFATLARRPTTPTQNGLITNKTARRGKGGMTNELATDYTTAEHATRGEKSVQLHEAVKPRAECPRRHEKIIVLDDETTYLGRSHLSHTPHLSS